jgi:putative peptidoglycan lipid II flippase
VHGTSREGLIERTAHIGRFAYSTAGTASVAAANLTVSLLLLGAVSPNDFGTYSFAQVMVAFGAAASNAVLASPLVIAVNRDEAQRGFILSSFASANVLIALAGAASMCAVLIAMGAPSAAVAALTTAAWLYWMRWYCRSAAYAVLRPRAAALSDISYSVVTAGLAIVLWLAGNLDLVSAGVLQIAGSAAGIAACGDLAATLRWRGPAHLGAFVSGFRRYGRDALTGVLSTEATANAHGYIVTFLLGPAAFAPLAAMALLFRPTSMVVQALNQLERPALARLVKAGDYRAAERTMRLMRIAVAATWVLSAGVAFAVLAVFGQYFAADALPESGGSVGAIAMLWALIFAARAVRGPSSTLIQATGMFRPLARATLQSSLITVPLVVVLAWTCGAAYSLLGILAGELVATSATVRIARRLKPDRSDDISADASARNATPLPPSRPLRRDTGSA